MYKALDSANRDAWSAIITKCRLIWSLQNWHPCLMQPVCPCAVGAHVYALPCEIWTSCDRCCKQHPYSSDAMFCVDGGHWVGWTVAHILCKDKVLFLQTRNSNCRIQQAKRSELPKLLNVNNSPECILVCRIRLDTWLNFFPQVSQIHLLIPKWIFRCVFRSDRLKKAC